MQGKGWQDFIDHLADGARREQRERRQETVGRVLYAVIFAALITFGVGLALQYLKVL
jgi:hypothetical protein